MKRRNKLWLINAANYYRLKYLHNRNENLWLFGAWRGRKFDDNSKYLFEYVCEHCPSITAVWMSNNEDVVLEVRKKGYRAEISDSTIGIELQKSAGIVFYTNGIDDFGDITYVYGAQVVALWHGSGFKKSYYTLITYKGIKLLLKHLKDGIFDFTYRDVSISTSELGSKWIMDCFNVPKDKIYITGFPRNDAFNRKYLKSEVIRYLEDADDFRYILYMPTYRSYDDSIIVKTVRSLMQEKTFVEFLLRNRIRFLLKLHPLTDLGIDNLPEGFFILKGDDITSVQELMAICDVFITDYSSAIVDFSIQKKPTILYTPDYKDYCKQTGIPDDLVTLYETYSQKDISKLFEMIMTACEFPETELELTNKINYMYESPQIEGTCYSENVIRTLETINSRKYICEK